MADIIAWTIVALMLFGFLRLGMAAGKHIMNPPRNHNLADKALEKAIQEQVNAALARRDSR